MLVAVLAQNYTDRRASPALRLKSVRATTGFGINSIILPAPGRLRRAQIYFWWIFLPAPEGLRVGNFYGRRGGCSALPFD